MRPRESGPTCSALILLVMSEELLNVHQQRALSVRLAMLERYLYDVSTLLSGEAPSGEMFAIRDDLTGEQKKAVLALVAQAREHIRILRDRFKLEMQQEDLRRRLMGHFSIFWSILEDSRARKLRGFGDVSPDLAAQLDGKLRGSSRSSTPSNQSPPIQTRPEFGSF